MQAKCDGCQRQWPVMQTSFHCSCGYVFQAHSVSEALSTASLIRQKLMEQIQSMDKAELRIRQTFSHSFTEWLNEMSFEFGFAFGTIAAYIKKWLDQVWSNL